MKKIKLEKHHLITAGLLVLCAACIVSLSVQFLSMREEEPIYPGRA